MNLRLLPMLALLILAPLAHAAENDAEKLSLIGRLLVAAPGLSDANFARSIIYLIKHDADGAVGVILNKTLGGGPLSALLKGFGYDGVNDQRDVKLHFGGPVQTDAAFVLHTPDFDNETTRRVSGGFSMTATRSILEAIAEGHGPRRALFALGYAGWSAGQLDEEIERGDWLDAPANEAAVFDDGEDSDSRWKRVHEAAGLTL